MLTRILTLLLLAIVPVSSMASSATPPELNKYVGYLVKTGSDVLNDDSLGEETKVKKVRELLAENLDLRWMAKYTLGRHRIGLGGDKLEEFVSIYSEYVVKSFSNLIKNYKGEKTLVQKVLTLRDNEFLVKTEITKTDGRPPVKVDYLVKDLEPGPTFKLKVSDIITEGVSMVNSQQSEFNGIINTSGFEALMSELKKKIVQ